MSDIKLRTESIRDDEFNDLAVTNANDKKIISSLKSSEPCLLEGSRGTGKSFLMRMAHLDLDSNKDFISVYIPFNISSLINTADPLQFYHWMLAKTLKTLLNKLKKKGLSVSDYSKGLLSNDTAEDDETIEKNLKNIVKLFENSYKNKSEINIDTLPDIEDVKEAIQEICEENDIKRVYFFFDEAAHVFRPKQQRQFFNLFKDLRSPYIVCNAAIYPGVTYFGDSFELIHDCLHQVLDRNISDTDYLSYFKEMVFKQIDDNLKIHIDKQGELFKTLVFSCAGNPRMLLNTIQNLSSFKTAEVNKIIKEFYLTKIWTEHTALGDKYKGHQNLIDWGRDFLEKTVIPTVVSNETSSIYFWIDKDIPETVKESLRLLTYTSIIKKENSNIRAHERLGIRYEIKYGCIIALEKNPHAQSLEIEKIRSVRRYTEFGKMHSEYDNIESLPVAILSDEQYQKSLESMLKQPISVLSLTSWQKRKLNEASINTIEELYVLREADLIAKIYGVGTARARIMKNAANAELLEYISG
ncbi:MAG: hypothetical protein ACI9TV_001903 [Sulfurimonas sp.]|jgi:hypothetical protein|uniref:ORC-CDC6 family AAA ATPase n=1 Tax=Sulfurimonas sp. TaxID=2022749 RepID=UPI0039E24C35